MAAKDPLLQQADTLWRMLDDLAENNPEGYTKFMDKLLKDNKDLMKFPEPVFCIETKKLPETSNHHIFINICKWDKVPAPTNENEKISVVSGEFQDFPDCKAKHSTIDICFHPTIINETANTSQCHRIIALMALEYVERQNGFHLSKAYKLLTIKYKGDERQLRKFVFGKHSSAKQAPEKSSDCKDESLLEELSKIARQGMEKKPSDLASDFKGLGVDPKVAKDMMSNASPEKPLIEEITPATTKEMPVSKKVVPKHNVKVLKADGERCRCIVVVVELPDVKSGTECELDVSKNDLVLSCPHYSKLQLQLPEKGSEDETTSTFNKTTHQLTVTIPVVTS